MTTMKTKLCFSILAVILALPCGHARAQNSYVVNSSTVQTIDPATGLPVSPAAAQWKDTNWTDPGIVLTNVLFDGLPLSEVARALRDQFMELFDILLPGQTASVAYLNGQPVPAEQHDWQNEQIELHLKNVTASEVFGAMNLLFENNRTPLRWELKVDGHHQIALLRVLVDPAPAPPPPPPTPEEKVERRVYFVGDLVDEDVPGSMSMEQLIKTITDVWQMANASGGTIQFHRGAQLLVVSGNPSQIDFMEQTLKALRMKADQRKIELAHPERYPQKSQAAPKPDASATPDK